MYKRGIRYVPLLRGRDFNHVDVVNERWQIGSGRKYSKQKTLDDGIEPTGACACHCRLHRLWVKV
ncbi:hypothetical protein BDR03DRAFT_971378 [Suillus americanus]|nr:hypothetical protein BDR03DRAFT_971378 [Suillus americanus]